MKQEKGDKSMKATILFSALFLTSAISVTSYADQICEAFPKCGAYTCVNYAEGEWKDASGKAVKGAFVTTEDFTTFQLFQSDDGTASGNIAKILDTCTR